MSGNPNLSFARTSWRGKRTAAPFYLSLWPGVIQVGADHFCLRFRVHARFTATKYFNSSQSFSSIDQKTLLAVTNTAVSHHFSRSLRNVKKQMVKLPNTTDSDEKGKSLWGWILVNSDRVWNFQKKTGCIWQSVPFMVILGSEMTKLWISILKN